MLVAVYQRALKLPYMDALLQHQHKLCMIPACCEQGLGLVLVAVYQRALKLLYVDALLERVRADFAKQYNPKRYDYASFEELFR